MIGYKIRFSDGRTGWQIMDSASRMTLGLFDASGNAILSPGDYAVTDAGSSPAVGASPLPGWVSNVFDPPLPPDPIPQQVSPFQARVALLNAGLLDAVNALMSNPQTPKEAVIAWEYANVVQRQSAFISALAPALGLNDAQIDGLFKAADAVIDA